MFWGSAWGKRGMFYCVLRVCMQGSLGFVVQGAQGWECTHVLSEHTEVHP